MKGGKLPWYNEKDMNKLEFIKLNITLDELCEGLPEEIKLFIKYSKEMEFYQEPDYEYLKSLLLKIAKKNNIDVNNVEFYWENNKLYNEYIKVLFEEVNEKEIGKDIKIVKEVKTISENDGTKKELKFLNCYI